MKAKLDFDIFFALFTLALIVIILVPLPPLAIDLLLSFSMALSVATLLLTLFVENILELSSFPTILLFLTLFRLGINIASTRLILSSGEAGRIIDTFGAFVTSGSTLIGLILFTILTIINFIVITKGAGRIAEVAARFTLEALPGKQSAIETDLSAGCLNQETAKEARKKLIAETDFYGAMDGSAKFIRGDAIATVLIVFINICGGFCIGTFVHGKNMGECFAHYTKLTIGEGLVSQIPALLLSIAAGILLTRGGVQKVSRQVLHQLFAKPKVLVMCGAIIAFLSFIPGMPRALMLFVSLLFFALAKIVKSHVGASMQHGVKSSSTRLEEALNQHPIALELSEGKLDIANSLLEALPILREEIVDEMGFIVPSIHIRDNLLLPSSEYTIKIKNALVFTGNDDDPLSQLKRQIIKHAHLLITRQDIAKMCEVAALRDLAVVEELIPHKISHGQILKVVQNLLKEGLPINDFISILEIMADHLEVGGSVDPDLLTEHVRQGLSSQFMSHLFGPAKVVYAVTFDQKVEQMIAAAFKRSEFGSFVALRPQTLTKIDLELKQLLERAKVEKKRPTILTSISMRRSLATLLDKYLPSLAILSYEEIDPNLEVRSIGTISNEVLI